MSSTTAVSGSPAATTVVQPGANLVININTAEKKDDKPKGGGYQPGRLLYYVAEAGIHLAMFSRTDGSNNPIYKQIYCIGLAVGAAFGFYESVYHKMNNVGLQERGKTFVDNTKGVKFLMGVELAILGPVGIKVAENLSSWGGNLVAGFWGWRAGRDASHFLHKTLTGK